MVLSAVAEVNGASAVQSRRSAAVARDTGLVGRVDGIAEGYAALRKERMESEWCGWRAWAGCYRVTTKNHCQHMFFLRVCCDGERPAQAVVMVLLNLRTFIRGLPAAHSERDHRAEASGESLPGTSRVVLQSSAAQNALLRRC
jgi:hypothetical protein